MTGTEYVVPASLVAVAKVPREPRAVEPLHEIELTGVRKMGLAPRSFAACAIMPK